MTAGKVHFEKKVMFIDNNARNTAGGALYLLSFSQLRLANNTNVTFINNTGRYNACMLQPVTSGQWLIISLYRLGAAVVVETGNFSLNMFDNIYYNPLCFLQYYNALIPPTLLDHVCV